MRGSYLGGPELLVLRPTDPALSPFVFLCRGRPLGGVFAEDPELLLCPYSRWTTPECPHALIGSSISCRTPPLAILATMTLLGSGGLRSSSLSLEELVEMYLRDRRARPKLPLVLERELQSVGDVLQVVEDDTRRRSAA